MFATIFVILGIITAISLYDFLSSRSWQMVTATDRVEAVFEHRNKTYGAYKIRRDYNLLVILITLSIGAAIGATYGITQALKKEVVVVKEKPKAMDLSTFTEDEKKEEEKELEPLEEPVPPEQKTLAFVPPVIVDKASEDEPTIQDDAKDANIDDKSNDGNDFVPPPDEVVTPPDDKKEEVIIHDAVEEQAEFPGGMAALKAYLANNIKYPEVALEMGIGGKCYLKFVVSTSGNISNVKVVKGVPDCKECDEEAMRVVRAMPNWAPAKNNGKAVNSYYNLPVTFKAQ